MNAISKEIFLAQRAMDRLAKKLGVRVPEDSRQYKRYKAAWDAYKADYWDGLQ